VTPGYCADRQLRSDRLVGPNSSRIPINSVNSPNQRLNPYSHNAAKSATIIRPGTARSRTVRWEFIWDTRQKDFGRSSTVGFICRKSGQMMPSVEDSITFLTTWSLKRYNGIVRTKRTMKDSVHGHPGSAPSATRLASPVSSHRQSPSCSAADRLCLSKAHGASDFEATRFSVETLTVRCVPPSVFPTHITTLPPWAVGSKENT
jgi:hypothetical protein